jgi:high frequency lysogenization protein
MARTLDDAALALAGTFQSAWLVNEVALRGRVPPAPFACVIESIFMVDPPDTPSVYGGVANLDIGLGLLERHLAGRPPEDEMPVVRYVLGVLHLERKLIRRQDLLDTLSTGIRRVQAQAGHFSTTHENVIGALADLYVNTISTLTPRIIVGGEHGYLSQPANANRVRALLLAAMRSAVLWRQNGGTRMQLIFRRRQIITAAQRLREAAQAS